MLKANSALYMIMRIRQLIKIFLQ